MDETLAHIQTDIREEKVSKDKFELQESKESFENKDGTNGNGEETEAGKKRKKDKYRKDKPWDDGTIDHWAIPEWKQGDMSSPLLEESSFATLFPQYREQYLKTIWPDVRACLEPHGILAELDLAEGSMTVKTSKKTWDPFILFKARDMIKLIARSVPFPQAKKVLEDSMFADIVKIKSFVRSKEKFVKRRQRLVGPNGSTLKALELLTECYLLVQGQTCCIMGNMKGIKQVRRIIEDCFHNIHPVYHIKELMIKRELEKDPALKDENWDRFLPKFKKRNVQTKKLKKKKISDLKKKKKEKTLFPPEQLPRKEDSLMETGEYFLSEEQKQANKKQQVAEKQKDKTIQRKRKRMEAFVPGEENMEPAAKKRSAEENKESNDNHQTRLQQKKTETTKLAEKLKEKSKEKKKSSGKDLLL